MLCVATPICWGHSYAQEHHTNYSRCYKNYPMGLKLKGDGCRQHPNQCEQCVYRKLWRLRTPGATLHHQKKKNQRDRLGNEMQRYRLGGIWQELWQTGRITSNSILLSVWRDRCRSTTPAWCQLWRIVQTYTLTKQALNKVATANSTMERNNCSTSHTLGLRDQHHLGQRYIMQCASGLYKMSAWCEWGMWI